MAETLLVLEKQAEHTNATKPIVVDPKKQGALADISKKWSAFSIGKKKEETIDYSVDDRAIYLLLKGAMLKSLDKADEAIALFKELLTLEPVVREKYYIAYGLFELGESLYYKGNIKEAQENMKKCNNMSGYDWEDPLKVRLRVVLDQLKKGGVIDENFDEEPSGAGPSPVTPPISPPEIQREAKQDQTEKQADIQDLPDKQDQPDQSDKQDQPEKEEVLSN